MKITVFTKNQPRHIGLIRALAGICDKVYAVQECTTVFPGTVKDIYDNSEVMNEYFKHVQNAEKEVFGDVGFIEGNVSYLALKGGDLGGLSSEILGPALDSDVYIVFGSSYIKGWLAEYLIKHKAVNIHMGVSPYYRGSSCNFWAAYDGRPELVGATIHLLGKGLDSGDILYHALPCAEEVDSFVLGMKAVKVAQDSLVERISNGELWKCLALKQDKTKECRYSRNSEFTDEVARDYLSNLLTPEQIKQKIAKRDLSMLYNPYVGKRGELNVQN